MAHPALAALTMSLRCDPAVPRESGLVVPPRVRLAVAGSDVPAQPPHWFSAPETHRWASLGARRKPLFLGSRVLLRNLLADAGGGSPEQWLLDGRGAPLDSASGLKTSISHHAARVAVAVCGATDGLGVDLERPRDVVDSGRIAARWFSADEQALLAQAEAKQMNALFYRLWTLKEAWVKATGRGLAGNFQAIQAEIDPVSGWRLTADTAATGWQAWSGKVEEDWLAVVWNSNKQTPPSISTATLFADRCGEVRAEMPAATIHLPVEPRL